MRILLSFIKRRKAAALLRQEQTWQEFYEHCKRKLFTLLRDALGSSQAAQIAFQKVFVLYARECVALRNLPSLVGVLCKAIEWLSKEPQALEVDESDPSVPPLKALPLESRLAFLIWYRLQLEPNEIAQVLHESTERVYSMALAASLMLYVLHPPQPVRS